MSTPKKERVIYFVILGIKEVPNSRMDTAIHLSVPPINFCLLTKLPYEILISNLWEKSIQWKGWQQGRRVSIDDMGHWHWANVAAKVCPIPEFQCNCRKMPKTVASKMEAPVALCCWVAERGASTSYFQTQNATYGIKDGSTCGIVPVWQPRREVCPIAAAGAGSDFQAGCAHTSHIGRAVLWSFFRYTSHIGRTMLRSFFWYDSHAHHMFRSFPVGCTQNSRFIPFPGYFSLSKKEFLLFSLEGSIEGLS